MALDLGKCFNAATIPIILLVVLRAVGLLGGSMHVLELSTISLVVLLASLVVLGWAGFIAAKKHGMGLMGGAVTGVIAGVIFGLINSILTLGLFLSGLDSGGETMINQYIFTIVFGLIIGVVIQVFQGAICGVVGAFIAQIKK